MPFWVFSLVFSNNKDWQPIVSLYCLHVKMVSRPTRTRIYLAVSPYIIGIKNVKLSLRPQKWSRGMSNSNRT